MTAFIQLLLVWAVGAFLSVMLLAGFAIAYCAWALFWDRGSDFTL